MSGAARHLRRTPHAETAYTSLGEPFASLCAEFQARAQMLTEMGAESQARAVSWCLERLEEGAREWQLAELTLEQAASESGLSYSALHKMVRDGRLDNLGEKGRPRVRRGDLPRNAPRPSRRQDSRGEPSLAEDVLAARMG